MKSRRSDILPAYGLRYHASWLLNLYIIFVFLLLLGNYQSIETWIYRNNWLSEQQQNDIIEKFRLLRPLRLDVPFLRWQKNFRNSAWLEYQTEKVTHPGKRPYKAGSLFYYSERQPLQMLLIGDSLAQSVELSLSPMLSNIPSIQLQAKGIVSSTLTNQHFANWPRTLRKLLNKKQYDIVLVFIGANSCQAIRYEDGSVVGYASSGWERAYSQKIREFIKIIKSQGAAVWWLINPPMRKKGYQQCMDSVRKIQRQVAGELAEQIIETTTILAAEDGSYTQSKIIDGRVYVLRTEDGVHFTLEGSRLVSEEILRRIYRNYRVHIDKVRLLGNMSKYLKNNFAGKFHFTGNHPL